MLGIWGLTAVKARVVISVACSTLFKIVYQEMTFMMPVILVSLNQGLC